MRSPQSLMGEYTLQQGVGRTELDGEPAACVLSFFDIVRYYIGFELRAVPATVRCAAKEEVCVYIHRSAVHTVRSGETEKRWMFAASFFCGHRPKRPAWFEPIVYSTEQHLSTTIAEHDNSYVRATHDASVPSCLSYHCVPTLNFCQNHRTHIRACTRNDVHPQQSTLLKSMAGLLKKGPGHVNEGSITYNGYAQNSSEFSLPKVAHFAEQVSGDELNTACMYRDSTYTYI